MSDEPAKDADEKPSAAKRKRKPSLIEQRLDWQKEHRHEFYYVGIFYSPHLVDRRWMRILPKEGDYIQLDDDKVPHRQICEIIHPVSSSPYDVIIELNRMAR